MTELHYLRTTPVRLVRLHAEAYLRDRLMPFAAIAAALGGGDAEDAPEAPQASAPQLGVSAPPSDARVAPKAAPARQKRGKRAELPPGYAKRPGSRYVVMSNDSQALGLASWQMGFDKKAGQVTVQDAPLPPPATAEQMSHVLGAFGQALAARGEAGRRR